MIEENIARRVTLDTVIRLLLRQRNAAVWHLFDSVLFLKDNAEQHIKQCRLCQRAAVEIRDWHPCPA